MAAMQAVYEEAMSAKNVEIQEMKSVHRMSMHVTNSSHQQTIKAADCAREEAKGVEIQAIRHSYEEAIVRMQTLVDVSDALANTHKTRYDELSAGSEGLLAAFHRATASRDDAVARCGVLEAARGESAALHKAGGKKRRKDSRIADADETAKKQRKNITGVEGKRGWQYMHASVLYRSNEWYGTVQEARESLSRHREITVPPPDDACMWSTERA